jgi:flavin reductase (DIM6/NTAB) family NADH-FMN oxidoreductase RutF
MPSRAKALMAVGSAAPRPDAATGVGHRAFRSALGRFATGVIVVTAGPRRRPHAMTANAFMSGSLEPPLVVVSVGRAARMHERLASVRRFGVSILDRDQEAASRHFAGQDVARFRPAFGVLAGVVVLAHASVLMAARIEHRYACGDHTLFVGRVEAIAIEEALPPLVYYNGRYRALQAAAAAPMAEAYPSFF